MNRVDSLWSKVTATRLWVLSVVGFWGATLLITLADFVGEKWLEVSWPSGPDLFPNMALGVPLAILQLSAAGLLLAAGVKLFSSNKSVAGAVLALLLVLLTGAACLAGFVMAAFWYQFDFMGRSM